MAIFTAFHLHVCQQMNGNNTIATYSGLIMGEVFPLIERVYPIIINSLGLMGAFLVIPILRVTGRKNNLVYGTFMLSVFLTLLGVSFYYFDFKDFSANSSLNIFFICIIMFCIRILSSCTNGPVVWIYVAETVQPNIVAIATTINWLTIGVVNTLFPILKQHLGGNPSFLFIFLGFYALIASFVNRVVLIETQDKN